MNLNLVGDTDTLDLDPRSFSKRLDIVELEILNEKKTKEITEKKNIDIGTDYAVSLKDVLLIMQDLKILEFLSLLLKKNSINLN